jgi:KUP system potassium uptake protein
MTTSQKGSVALSLGALGVVFGDIGTSPLYALSAIFGSIGYKLPITEANVFGVVSLVLWAIMLVVSVKFVWFIMKADNAGEGGIMALVAEVKEGAFRGTGRWLFFTLGLIGISLFYGDSTITPAISVLSAVEGLKVVAPGLSSTVIPITLVLLGVLFGIQRYGTTFIGKLFGPVMAGWFAVIAAGGAFQIWQYPSVLVTLSPHTALMFFITQPKVAFVAMGAVILAITGAEALYADMGHFGRKPIARSWFFVVFPALILCYMGQSVLLLHTPGAGDNPLVLLFPTIARIPVVLLATMATIIASQAVISGAFSLTRQAIQLGLLPRMLIKHPSTNEGQIYVPFINIFLFISVVILVVSFGSSARLANAYGIAVSGTLAADTLLYLAILRSKWHVSGLRIMVTALAFLPIDILFIAATLPKLTQGGLFPILVAAAVYLVITTWIKGKLIASDERKEMEGSIEDFVSHMAKTHPPIPRVAGTAVYISHHPGFAPLALQATVRDFHELPQEVLIVTVETVGIAHVPEEERGVFDELGKRDDGIARIALHYGFHDSPNVPRDLAFLKKRLPKEVDLDAASYFVSMSRVVPNHRHNLARWRKQLFGIMSRNATSSTDYYKLPIERTVEMQSLIPL